MTRKSSYFEKLLDAVTAIGVGESVSVFNSRSNRSFQASVAGTGAVAATVLIEVSNDNVIWDTLVTFTLNGADLAHDKLFSGETWPYVRGNVTAVTGTDAAVTLTMAT